MGHLSSYFLSNTTRFPTILHFRVAHHLLPHLPRALDTCFILWYYLHMGVVIKDHRLELVKVAYLFYEAGLGVREIAQIVNKSPSTVSRMLKSAKASGIVTIKIAHPFPRVPELEKSLQNFFPAIEFFVLDASCFAKGLGFKARLGRAAGSYLHLFLKDADCIGVGGGETLANAIAALSVDSGRECSKSKVVQLSGLLSPMITPASPAVTAHNLCFKLNSEGYFYMLPGSVKDIDNAVYSQIRADVHKLWEMVSVALVGIGEARDTLTSVRLGTINKRILQNLVKKGAVGDILLHFYDLNGDLVDPDFDRQVAGISWDQLKAIPKVVAIAGGSEKVKAIHGALASKVVDVLITDSETAVALLSDLDMRVNKLENKEVRLKG